MLSFYNVLTQLRDACASALRDAGDPMGRVVVMPGAVAWDECDQCGLLALAAGRNFLADQFPVEVNVTTADQGAVLCSDMVVQPIRCAPSAQGSDTSPSTDALERSARQVNDDATIIMCTVVDTLNKLTASGDIYDFMIRQQPFAGPEGGCVGSELSFVVGIIR